MFTLLFIFHSRRFNAKIKKIFRGILQVVFFHKKCVTFWMKMVLMMKTQLLKLLFKSKVTAQNTNLFEIAFPPNSSLSRLLSINAKASHDPQLLMGQNIYKSQRGKNNNKYENMSHQICHTETRKNV